MSLKLGHVGSKSRALGQTLEKPCVCSRGHIFSQIFVTQPDSYKQNGNNLLQEKAENTKLNTTVLG